MARTKVEIKTSEDVFEVARAWALSFDYALLEKTSEKRSYEFKYFMGLQRNRLEITKKGNAYSLQAWMTDGLVEMSLSGPRLGVRKKFRDQVNKLLDLLEQPRI